MVVVMTVVVAADDSGQGGRGRPGFRLVVSAHTLFFPGPPVMVVVMVVVVVVLYGGGVGLVGYAWVWSGVGWSGRALSRRRAAPRLPVSQAPRPPAGGEGGEGG